MRIKNNHIAGEFFNLLHKKLRINLAWQYKAPFLISIPYFMIATGEIAPSQGLIGFLMSLLTIWGIAGLAYFLNDLFDVEQDRLAGKPNLVAHLNARQRIAVFVFLLVAALAPWLYLPVTPITAGLLLLELALFYAYASPPFRLKERGIPGMVADALYAHALPALLAGLTFYEFRRDTYSDLGWFLLFLGLWQFFLGMRNIAFHLIRDGEADLRSGTKTPVTLYGVQRMQQWLNTLFIPLEVALFLGWAVTVGMQMQFFLPAVLSCTLLTIVRLRWLWGQPLPRDQRNFMYKFFDDLYVDWIPLLFLMDLIRISPVFLIIGIVHLLMFRNGLIPTVREFYFKFR